MPLFDQDTLLQLVEEVLQLAVKDGVHKSTLQDLQEELRNSVPPNDRMVVLTDTFLHVTRQMLVNDGLWRQFHPILKQIEPIASRSSEETTTSRNTVTKLHKFWGLAAKIAPPEARRTCFDPAFEDLKREHFLDRQKLRGKWERRWLKCCFCWHAFRMILQTIRVWACVKVALMVKGLLSIFTS